MKKTGRKAPRACRAKRSDRTQINLNGSHPQHRDGFFVGWYLPVTGWYRSCRRRSKAMRWYDTMDTGSGRAHVQAAPAGRRKDRAVVALHEYTQPVFKGGLHFFNMR